MLKACWAFEPESRPDIQDIIDLFVDNPELLKPCLDAPTAAVAMDTTSDLEMDMPSKLRQSRTMQQNRISLGNTSISEHSRDGTSRGGTHSPTSPTLAMLDPFSILGNMTRQAGAKIAALPSVIRSPLSRSMSVGDGRNCNYTLRSMHPEVNTSCAQEEEDKEESKKMVEVHLGEEPEGNEGAEEEFEECFTTEPLCQNGGHAPGGGHQLPRHYSIPVSLEDRRDKGDFICQQLNSSPKCRNARVSQNNGTAVHMVV